MNLSLFNRIDLVIVPVMLLLITIFLFLYRSKQSPFIRKFLFPAFFLRVFGAFSSAAITEFYYHNGDTYQFFFNAQFLRLYFLKNPSDWLKIMFQPSNSGTMEMTSYLDTVSEFSVLAAAVFKDPFNSNACKIASLFNLICFDSSLGIAIFFGLLSFLGCWYIFKTFTHLYPGYEKQFAWLCLFLPSLWFWGSGILKDPICIFGLGLLLYNFFVVKSGLLRRVVLMILGAWILISIKPYIFYAFAGAAVLGPVLTFFKTKGIVAKFGMVLFFAFLLVIAYPFLAELITESLDKIIAESQNYLVGYAMQAEEGDSNFLPKLDPTPLGFLKLAFTGFFTVYLRPFPWEFKKILYLFLILENIAIYYVMFKQIKSKALDFGKGHRKLANFSLVFFVFMGIIVGVTAFNFGTIARYRVPGLPFLFAGILALRLSKRKLKEGVTVFPAPSGFPQNDQSKFAGHAE